jgi:hypothetical protein
MRFLDLGHQDINQSVLDLAAAARIFQGENSPKFLTDMWTSRFQGDPRNHFSFHAVKYPGDFHA